MFRKPGLFLCSGDARETPASIDDGQNVVFSNYLEFHTIDKV
jgi:hypothetical protein